MADTLTEGGAGALARAVEKYWAAQGKTVSTWVEEVNVRTRELRGRAYAVRSDMVNGLPRAS